MRNSMHQRLGGSSKDETVASGGGCVGGGVPPNDGPVVSEMWDESSDAPIFGARTNLYETYMAFAPFTECRHATEDAESFRVWGFKNRAMLFLKRHPHW